MDTLQIADLVAQLNLREAVCGMFSKIIPVLECVSDLFEEHNLTSCNLKTNHFGYISYCINYSVII